MKHRNKPGETMKELLSVENHFGPRNNFPAVLYSADEIELVECGLEIHRQLGHRLTEAEIKTLVAAFEAERLKRDLLRTEPTVLGE